MRRAWNAGAPLMVAIGVLAFVTRLVPVLRGGGLHGVLAYDDGVYFASAESLVFGRLPYRDFLLLHPPAIVLLLSPFAWVGRLGNDDSVGLALARLAFMTVGALNAVLVYRVARAALGGVAGAVAGLFYAVWPPAVYAERTTLLEPLVNLGLLVGLLLLGDPRTVSRRRLVAAGAVLGFATTVKLWAVVPLVVLLCWVAVRRGRGALAFVAAAAAATATVCLPFFALAPSTMFRQVVTDQVARPEAGVTWQRRLAMTMTARYHLFFLEPGWLTWFAVVPTVLVLVAVAVAVRRSPPARPWCALLVAQGTLLLTSPAYFPHYATYVAPALALVVGATVADLLGVLRRFAPAWAPVAVAVTVLAGVGLLAVSGLRSEGRRYPGENARATVAAARCVAADAPAILLTGDLLVRDLRAGCAVVVDPTGLVYDLADLSAGNTLPSRRANTGWQHQMQRWFAASDAVVLRRHNRAGLSAETLHLLSQGREVSRHGRYLIYLRR